MDQQQDTHPVVGYRLYLTVWLALVVLTCITVGVSYLDMKKFTVFTAMLIATVKGGLVLLYFMHLRYEKLMYWAMILFIMATYAAFVILTFTDYGFR